MKKLLILAWLTMAICSCRCEVEFHSSPEGVPSAGPSAPPTPSAIGGGSCE